MNNILYLNNSVRIYQKIYDKYELLLQLKREALLLRLQFPRDNEKIQENDSKINIIKNEIQQLQARLVLLTL